MMDSIRLLSTTSAQDRDSITMAALEDLHHRLLAISTKRIGTLTRHGPCNYEWLISGSGVLRIEPHDPDDFGTSVRSIMVEWEGTVGDSTDDVAAVLPDYPIPTPYTDDDALRTWVGGIAANLRLALDAYGRPPVILDGSSVEKCAYDAALAIATMLHDKVSQIHPHYATRNPVWQIDFPLPWASGRIRNESVEIAFEDEIDLPIHLAKANVFGSAPPVFGVERFSLKRDGRETPDVLDRLALHADLGILSAFCCAKVVASGKSSD